MSAQMTLEDYAKEKKRQMPPLRKAIETYMLSHCEYRTPYQIQNYLRQLGYVEGTSDACITARLRDLRKPQFGNFTVDKQIVRKGCGMCEYRVSRKSV